MGCHPLRIKIFDADKKQNVFRLLTTICALHLIAENVKKSKENFTVLSTTRKPNKPQIYIHVADGDLKLLSELEKKVVMIVAKR